MNIVYLGTAADDLVWFRHYYEVVFPEGADAAYEKMESIHLLLTANPHLGFVSDDVDDARELPIPKTPFALIYAVARTEIHVLRLWDSRQDPVGKRQ